MRLFTIRVFVFYHNFICFLIIIMDVFNLFKKEACDIRGKFGSDKWTWKEYFDYKKELESE